MEPLTIGIIGIGVLFFLLAFRLPVAPAMLLVSFLGFLYLNSFEAGLSILSMSPFKSATNYSFVVVPFFVFMGIVSSVSGLSAGLFQTAYKWLGQFKGGLSMATIAACGAFAAICGTSVATALTMGSVALPEMKKYNYAPTLATGCVAAGGTLGILIPPSGNMMVYGLITGTSIGDLFIAGILPGITLALLFILTVKIITIFNAKAGPAGPKSSIKEKIVVLTKSIDTILLFLLVMGGIYGGLFTPTEAGAVGAAGAIIVAIIHKRLTWKKLYETMHKTTTTTCMTFIIVIAGIVFSRFMAITTVPFALSDFVADLAISPMLVMAVIFFLYMILGCFLDVSAMILLSLPIFFPVVLNLGIDPVWFGIMSVVASEMALITPPVGMVVFVIYGLVKDEVSMFTVYRGVAPFIAPMWILIILMMFFPQIVLFFTLCYEINITILRLRSKSN